MDFYKLPPCRGVSITETHSLYSNHWRNYCRRTSILRVRSHRLSPLIASWAPSVAIAASYKDFNSTIFGELKKLLAMNCVKGQKKRESSFQSWNFRKTLELDCPRACSKCCWASLASQQDQKRPPAGQAKKQSSCCCCRVAGGLDDSTLWSASLCCCSVRSCHKDTQQMCERLKCTLSTSG